MMPFILYNCHPICGWKFHFWEFHFPSQYQVWYISSSQTSMLSLMRAYCSPYMLSEMYLSCAWCFLLVIEFRLAICKWLMLNKGLSTPTSVDLVAVLLDQWLIVLLTGSCVWSCLLRFFHFFPCMPLGNVLERTQSSGDWLAWGSWPPPQTLLTEMLPVFLGLIWIKRGNLIINFCWLEGLDGGLQDPDIFLETSLHSGKLPAKNNTQRA